MRRDVVTFWHLCGYWAVVLVAAVVLARRVAPFWVIVAGAVVWLPGLVRAAVRRDRTIAARLGGLVALGLAAFLGWPEHAPLSHLLVIDPREPLSLPLSLLEGMVGVAFAGAVLGTPIWVLREKSPWPRLARTRDVWLWHAAVFPVGGFLALLLAQGSAPLAVLVLTAVPFVWLWRFVWAVEDRRPLLPRLVGLGLLVAFVFACRSVPLDASRDDIAEAVFRHELAGRRDRAVFLRVGGVDPGEELLRRLADLPCRVRPASASGRRDGDELMQGPVVIDPETGEDAVIVRVDIDSIRRSWSNPLGALVDGSRYRAPLAASGGTYVLAWMWGRWVVVGEHETWIS